MSSVCHPPASVLVVDDEPLARNHLRRRLEGRPNVVYLGEARNGVEALEAIRRERPDLLFLDVQMPDLDGFQVLGLLRPEEVPVVVFVTAYDAYALDAFEVAAVDYLLKPYDDRRFEEALERAYDRWKTGRSEALMAQVEQLLRSRRDGSSDGGPVATESYPGRLEVRRGSKRVLLPVHSIQTFEAEDVYVRITTLEESFLIRRTLRSLESELDPALFVRIHRSTIVRRGAVRELHARGRGEFELRLVDGRRVRSSRTYRRAVAQLAG